MLDIRENHHTPSLRFMFFFLILDAWIFALCLYKVGDAWLLWNETVYPFSLPAARLAVSLLALLALSLFSPMRCGNAPSSRCTVWLKKAAGDIALLLVFAVLLPLLAAHKNPVVRKDISTSISFLWMPIEWHKLAMNIGLLAKSFPFFAVMVLLFHCSATYVLVCREKRKPVALVYLAVGFFLISRISYMHASERKTFFWLVFGLPYFSMAAAAYAGKKTWFARLSVPAFAFTVLWGFYTAFLPFSFSSALTLPPGMTLLYPARGGEKMFPTEYMRDVYVDEEKNLLYTCYGPTSGIVRLDLNTGKTDIIHTKGLLRHFWTEKLSPYIYGVDWIYDELWLVRKKDFSLEKTVSLRDDVLIAPIDIELSPSAFFVVSTEYPALTRFSRHTLKKTAQINFRAQGCTRFRSGAWVMARDPLTQKLFVEMGMVNRHDDFMMVRVNEQNFQIEKQLVLPGGGLAMLAVPEKRSIFLGDFYSAFLYEMDMDTLRVKRKIRAPLNCRSLAYDAKRNFIYAASFITGEMAVLRYRDGKMLKKVFAGKKPSEIYYSSAHDALYFGSSLGVLKVDLRVFLKDI